MAAKTKVAAKRGGHRKQAKQAHGKKTAVKGAASRYRPGLIAFPHINTLEQVRKRAFRHPYDEETWTYENIDTLADDLAQRWFINPVQVAVCTRQQAVAYLTKVNKVWETNYQLSDLVGVRAGGKCWYWILISGHRRLEAVSLLWNYGCKACRDEYGVERPGQCYRRHSPHRGRELRVHRYYNIDPTTALAIQLSENLHDRVSPHQNADALFRLYASERMDDPELTIGGFARRCEVSPDTVKRAVRYCNLPAEIQRDCEQGRLKFGVALELGRLRDEAIVPVEERVAELEAGGQDEELLATLRNTLAEVEFKLQLWHWCALVEKWSLKTATTKVDQILRELNNGWMSLLGDNLASVMQAQERAGRKAMFERKLGDAIHAFMRYWRRYNLAVQAGDADVSEALYTDPINRGLLRETVELCLANLPGMRAYLREQEASVVEAVLGETDKICHQLDVLAGLAK